MLGNTLVESSGLYGLSDLRLVRTETGDVSARVDLSPMLFAEGVTVWRDSIYVLTWHEHTCLVYGSDLTARGQFEYEGEGWGLTHNDASLIMSDGTSVLRFVNPATFDTERVLRVTDGGKDLSSLNELEFIHGRIWANVWPSSTIVEIDPATGDVVLHIDLSGLDGGQDQSDANAVANGIAYSEATNTVFVTGKRWSRLFEFPPPS